MSWSQMVKLEDSPPPCVKYIGNSDLYVTSAALFYSNL